MTIFRQAQSSTKTRCTSFSENLGFYTNTPILHQSVSQTRGWSQEDIEIYDDIKQKADKVVYTSQEYTRGCMHKRNRHLVDNSSACISYLTENKGGTFYTVNYAKSKGVEVINIAE